ncbi:ABC transporter permease [Megalodesulfovibrio gigas]|uniref:Putative ABC transporter permease n=1 Tax=Megalodesulfovibrio gigas (strain ATCC 19364 / DSM 1382 / NCIMB 9332 / VKM B-1759) TaxID=1121448 RepID=T2GES5_MEGG1|nr:ABC transporter permease [Megalodesulfovibrio gigas]AGW14669.1 putative ABC transporter permease [Megalodesulfovibrio gigas DSM 1382 = ATCC 19364]
MAVPLSYSWRNLARRRLTTALTAGGMALVVFVFAATLMLAEGLRQTLVATGSPHNAILLRKGAETEVQSGIERWAAGIVRTSPEIAPGQDGLPLVARELLVLIGLPKKRTGVVANVPVRGVEPASLGLRPEFRLLRGRLPRPGSTEVLLGMAVARGFAEVDLGQALQFAQARWPVVGVFDVAGSGFGSEVWGDVEVLMQAFRRQAFSTVVLRLRDDAALESLQVRLAADPRLQVDVFRETAFYEKQSEMMATFLRVLGVSLTAIFSLGAMIGAMITMYSAVATRIAEIGALRALGFGRGSILLAFLLEALLLGLLGGAVGVLAASALTQFTFSTTNFQTFSELAFTFRLTPGIAGLCLGFAAFMGVAGGLLPAVRAARLSIVEALRGA